MQITDSSSEIMNYGGFFAVIIGLSAATTSILNRIVNNARRYGTPQPDEEAQEARDGLAGEDERPVQGGPHQSGAGGPGAQAEVTARSAW